LPAGAAGDSTELVTRSVGLSALLEAHQAELRACRRCPDMTPPVVSCGPVASEVLLVGQAPGKREGALGRPFAWTAGKTLFGWFERLGIREDEFRERVYMAAVCRCFPGSLPSGGDRVPSPDEVARCGEWLARDVELLQPKLVIPVGRLAIAQFVELERLADVVGSERRVTRFGRRMDAIFLPHPSGASTWHRTEPGRSLLERALELVGRHIAFRRVLRAAERARGARERAAR
jgi:uracil-DNA glycosylase